MPPDTSGSIPRVRTYAEDLRRAQGMPVVPTDPKTPPQKPTSTSGTEKPGAPAQETLRAQPTALHDALRDAHGLADTPKSDNEIFDIRHEEKHGGDDATILSDKRIRRSLFAEIPRILRGWLRFLVTAAEGGSSEDVASLTSDVAPSVDPRKVGATAPVPHQPVPASVTMPHPTTGQPTEMKMPISIPTTPTQRPIAQPIHQPEASRGQPERWSRVNEPRTPPTAAQISKEHVSFKDADTFKQALKDALAKRPEPAMPDAPPKTPLKVAPKPAREIPREVVVTIAPVILPPTTIPAELVTPAAPPVRPVLAPDPREVVARNRLEALRPEEPKSETMSSEEPLLPPRSIPFERPRLQNTMSAPIRTYRIDALSDIKERQMSASEIATEEMIRRSKTGAPIVVADGPSRLIPVLAVIVVILALGMIGTAAYLKFKDRKVEVEPAITNGVPALFRTTQQLSYVVPQERAALLNALNELRLHTTLAPQELAQFYGSYTDQNGEHTASTAYLFDILDPRIGGAFERSLGPVIVTGSYGEKQNAYLVLTTDQFETAFAGMLAWENMMSIDLSPYFGGPVRLSYDPYNRSVGSARPAHFIDEVYQNMDTRVLYDEFGELRLIYAFPDASHIIIATSLDTLAAVETALNED